MFDAFLKLVFMIDCMPENIFGDQLAATKCVEELLDRVVFSA